MSYQLKRIDPFWFIHPMIPTGVALGAICGAIGYVKDQNALLIIGGVMAGAAVVFGTKPVFSALLGSLGIFGGLVTFVFIPNLNMAGMGLLLRLFSAGLFAAFYMVLMDALVLVIAVLYNFFAGTVGLSALGLDWEERGEDSVS